MAEFFAVLFLELSLMAQTAHYGKSGSYKLPDPKVTPGATLPYIEADSSAKPHVVGGIEYNVCAKDFRTGPFRKVDESEKKKACEEYGAKNCPGKNWEIDHLISLEIGGSDSIKNLWPQPIREARIKDHEVEDVLPKLVCSGKITLKQAQACISSDWVTCAKKYGKLK